LFSKWAKGVACNFKYHENNLSNPSIYYNLFIATHGKNMHEQKEKVVNMRFLGSKFERIGNQNLQLERKKNIYLWNFLTSVPIND
jgi:hypothetical protein